jgi:ABC-2 type transport system permease protein
VTPSATDRGAWRLVARRDFWVRLRERSFIVSTLINLVVISVLISIRAFGGASGDAHYQVGVLRGGQIEARLAALGDAVPGVHARAVSFPQEDAARAAVAEGRVDAALIGEQLVVDKAAPTLLVQLVRLVVASERQDVIFQRYGVSQDDREAFRRGPPVTVEYLQPGDPNREQNEAIAFVGMILLYGQLFGYGVWVASGVLEEKSSRVVEILLAAIRARQLMGGKIVGIGLLGLLQLAFIGGFAIALALLTGAIDLPGSAVSIAALDIGFFVLAFAFYASLFAVAGALVSRREELQNVLVPVNLVIIVSFFISISALANPDSSLVRVASILPTSSALAMPVRIAVGVAAWWEIALAVGLSIAGTLLLIPLAGRAYAGAVLRTGGRVRLRDAWRAAA